ncbi:Serine hydroxymethyltransferase, mitochondrial [Artemisia annua]|uniref:Serine hydroxymethyltransferase, mitochondrial n=1 Tax=Artemisia annua TaxID=35608 RepID=A0A2U1NMU9_ARTAN|nr:Serine hydroxymethyltransferase, mitochondrial [Artemisia annua]
MDCSDLRYKKVKLDETTGELATFLTMKCILGLNQKLTDFTKLSTDREMRNMFLRCFIALTHVCRKQKLILLSDIAHIKAIVVAGVIPSPFEYTDVVPSHYVDHVEP